MPSLSWGPRLRAATVHLVLSLLVALAAAWLVFRMWYPSPYQVLAGGQGLFLLVVSVDVVLGPLLTLAVFNAAKGWRRLRVDLAAIGLVQAVALAYGLHTCFVARPVILAFEGDRFRVVAAVEVLADELPKASPSFRSLSIHGPELVGVRRATDEERYDAIMLATQGFDTGQRPTFWVDYAQVQPQAAVLARPLEAVLGQCPGRRAPILGAVRAAGLAESAARALPLISRESDWSVLVDTTGRVAGFLPCDVFSVPRPEAARVR